MGKYYLFTAIAFLLTFSKSNCQTFNECSVDGPIFTRVENPPQFNGALAEYFDKAFQKKFNDFSGPIMLSVLIDTGGKACCMSIRNNSSDVSSLEIKNAVNGMPAWKPAKQNNYIVPFSAMLQLMFSGGKLSVNYLNEKVIVPKPFVNPNTSNHPEITKDKKSKTIWKHWDISNSVIPANLSRSVAADSNGIIWYCTDNGIVRIADDDHWQVFNNLNTPALENFHHTTWTTGLSVEKNGNVWVESSDHVVKYDGKQWLAFDTTNSPLKLVRKICVDKNGIIWFCSFKGLIKYDGTTWTKYSMANSKIASDNVEDIYVDDNDVLWIATENGINKVKNGNWSVINKDNSKIPWNEITAIKGDNKGNTWAGTGTSDNYYLYKINPEEKIEIFPAAPVWNITIDNSTGKVWLATSGKGLASFDGKDLTYYDKSNSAIPDNIVSDILIDKNGDKWISTFRGLVFTNMK